MFDKKQEPQKVTVENERSTTNTGGNAFIAEAMKKGAETLSDNGALKFSKTDSDFVTEMGKLGSYKTPRTFKDVASTMSILWAKNPFLCLCMLLFVRMITRVTSFLDGTKTSTVQRGQGLRHEGIMRMIWLHENHKDVFWKNIGLYISVGSWKDIITMLSYDYCYNGWKKRVLDWDAFGKLLLAGLENPNSSQLIKKYLPQIKSNSQCKTIEAQADNAIGKWLCALLFGNKGENTGWTYKQYRKLKTSGTAHEWQQLISQGKHELINFDTVHGRALAQLVSGKYLENNKLTDKYTAWIESKPIAKFTGYVNELFKVVPSERYKRLTIDAQFKSLVETAKKGAVKISSLIVVRDISGSMDSKAQGSTQSSGEIAKALSLFFSYMLPKGKFADSEILFASKVEMNQWVGSTPCEKWENNRRGFVGSTNFQGVIDLLCTIKKSGVVESEFPTGILCVSDCEFNPTRDLSTTNVQAAFTKLTAAGFSEDYVKNFQIILWNIPNEYGGDKFETFDTKTPNVFYFSGYDGSTIAFLTGIEGEDGKPAPAPKTAEELMVASLSQEVMKLITM